MFHRSRFKLASAYFAIRAWILCIGNVNLSLVRFYWVSFAIAASANRMSSRTQDMDRFASHSAPSDFNLVHVKIFTRWKLRRFHKFQYNSIQLHMARLMICWIIVQGLWEFLISFHVLVYENCAFTLCMCECLTT